MELEEAIEILNNYLCETHRKFCSIGAVGIPNKEYFAIETALKHLTKQDKMIELLIEDLQGEGCLNMTREEIDNFYERRIKLAEESE